MRVENFDLLRPDEVAAFDRPSPARWLLAVAKEWLVIGAAIAAALWFPLWWVWLVAALVVATRQNALGILTHEGTHCHVAGSVYWNDLLANWLTAYPMFISSEGFRTVHMRHHNHLEMTDDPSRIGFDLHPEDWTFPTSRGRLAWILLRDISALGQAKSSVTLLRYVWNAKGRAKGGRVAGGFVKHLIRIVALHGTALTAAIVTGHLAAYVLLWVAPLFTVALALYRMRGTAEHCGIVTNELRYTRTTNEPLLTTRTIVPHALMRLLVVPHHVTYHLEHHLYSGVPFFRLRRLHERLMTEPRFRTEAHITRGHRALIRELTSPIAPQPFDPAHANLEAEVTHG